MTTPPALQTIEPDLKTLMYNLVDGERLAAAYSGRSDLVGQTQPLPKFGPVPPGTIAGVRDAPVVARAYRCAADPEVWEGHFMALHPEYAAAIGLLKCLVAPEQDSAPRVFEYELDAPRQFVLSDESSALALARMVVEDDPAILQVHAETLPTVEHLAGYYLVEGITNPVAFGGDVTFAALRRGYDVLVSVVTANKWPKDPALRCQELLVCGPVARLVGVQELPRVYREIIGRKREQSRGRTPSILVR